jgi:hypothetical protein
VISPASIPRCSTGRAALLRRAPRSSRSARAESGSETPPGAGTGRPRAARSRPWGQRRHGRD